MPYCPGTRLKTSRARRSRRLPAGIAPPPVARRTRAAAATANGAGWGGLQARQQRRPAPALRCILTTTRGRRTRPHPATKPRGARWFGRVASARQDRKPSRDAISGPSGSTQLAEVTPNTGARLYAPTAHSPARRENSRAVKPNRSHVDTANKAMNGDRTARGASVWKSCEAPQASHQLNGGWSK